MCNRLTVQASSMRVLCENDVKWLSNYRWVKTTCSFQNRRRSECLWAIASESRWPRSCRAPQATSPPRRKTCHWTVAARSRPASSATWPAGWRRFVAPTQRAKAALCFEVCRRGVLPLLWNRQAGAHETLGKRFCSGSSRNKLPDSAGGDRDNHGSTQMRKRCIFVLAHLSLQSSRLSCAFYLPFVAARQLSHISWVVESPGTTGPALLLRFWSDVCVQLARTALVNLYLCFSAGGFEFSFVRSQWKSWKLALDLVSVTPTALPLIFHFRRFSRNNSLFCLIPKQIQTT